LRTEADYVLGWDARGSEPAYPQVGELRISARCNQPFGPEGFERAENGAQGEIRQFEVQVRKSRGSKSLRHGDHRHLAIREPPHAPCIHARESPSSNEDGESRRKASNSSFRIVGAKICA